MKYFFNLRSEDGDEPDDVGVELSSLHDAEEEARRAAREIIADLVLENRKIDGMTFEVVDEDGKLVSTVPFRNLVL